MRDWGIHPLLMSVLLVCVALLAGMLSYSLFSFFVRRRILTNKRYVLFASLFRHEGRPVSVWISFFILNLFLPVLGLPKVLERGARHLVEVALICCTAWILTKLVRVIQDVVHHRINDHKADNLRERRLLTQLMYLRRVVTVVIVLVAFAAVLYTFDTMRKIGAGLLTGVGVGGIIIGFAAQRSLSNLLAGFQIAFTQPIRIDDEVVVEGQFGTIEEITLTYVVVRIWDDRRLVLPINYFLEKPFENWTRSTADLLGTVYLYTDYSLPVEWLRKEFLSMLQDHPLWDKRAGSLSVTDAKENVMEVRALVSSASSGDVWDLRCQVREHLVKLIQEHYPSSLPKVRAVLQGPAVAGQGVGASKINDQAKETAPGASRHPLEVNDENPAGAPMPVPVTEGEKSATRYTERTSPETKEEARAGGS